jgi:NTE family protein
MTDAVGNDAPRGQDMDARTSDGERDWGLRPNRCDRVALVLQGGGALGAYQAGVYEALHEARLEPDWVSGVSIGAINAAIIAGNPIPQRMDKLRGFWERITARRTWAHVPDGDIFRQAVNVTSALVTASFGQPGFFKPRVPGPYMSAPGAVAATSFYDTSALRETLLEFVDFDLLNSGAVHFSVGAVNVVRGNYHYFDNTRETIEPEHIMASGALPPAFPMVKIGTEYWWDGGIVSNTPLQYLLDQDDSLNALVFQVDLFNARGPKPRDMAEVMARHKDIMYSSRTRYTTDIFTRMYALKEQLAGALKRIPDADLSPEERALKEKLSHQPEMTILQLIYQQKVYEGHAKDYEFSAASMREHWESGREDTARTLRHREWIVIPPPGAGIVVYDVHREYTR